MKPTQKARALEIFEHYGLESQFGQLIEECAELIQAVNKFKRACRGGDFRAARDELLGEIADVKIMIAEFEAGFFGSEAVDRVVDAKLGRQARRIRDEKAARNT